MQYYRLRSMDISIETLPHFLRAFQSSIEIQRQFYRRQKELRLRGTVTKVLFHSYFPKKISVYKVVMQFVGMYSTMTGLSESVVNCCEERLKVALTPGVTATFLQKREVSFSYIFSVSTMFQHTS